MNTMYIGSGDTTALLAGLNTETHYKLLRRFVSGVKPYYNARASPIDALRTGAILEERYLLTLPDNYYAQYLARCEELDVLKSSLDFAKIEAGRVVDFDELKTCGFDSFLALEEFRDKCGLNFIKKHYKNYYHQVQFQLLCTGLAAANLVFLVVYSYDDSENYTRDIKPNEMIRFRIERDDEVLSLIRSRAGIFQQIKNHYLINSKNHE